MDKPQNFILPVEDRALDSKQILQLLNSEQFLLKEFENNQIYGQILRRYIYSRNRQIATVGGNNKILEFEITPYKYYFLKQLRLEMELEYHVNDQVQSNQTMPCLPIQLIERIEIFNNDQRLIDMNQMDMYFTFFLHSSHRHFETYKDRYELLDSKVVSDGVRRKYYIDMDDLFMFLTPENGGFPIFLLIRPLIFKITFSDKYYVEDPNITYNFIQTRFIATYQNTSHRIALESMKKKWNWYVNLSSS